MIGYGAYGSTLDEHIQHFRDPFSKLDMTSQNQNPLTNSNKIAQCTKHVCISYVCMYYNNLLVILNKTEFTDIDPMLITEQIRDLSFWTLTQTHV